MRTLHVMVGLALAACGGNDANPRVIAGGGIGDGAIDGTLNVYVIDANDEHPLAATTVRVGTTDVPTDTTGLAVFKGLTGPQTIVVKATNYRSAVWVDANGANVTMALTPLSSTPAQATLSGTITGWDTVMVAAQHVKAGYLFYSQDDRLGDPANNLATPNMGNICGIGSTTCNWTLVTRTGTLSVVAAFIDRDTKGTPLDLTDDTSTIIGWATATGVVVASGVNQSGLALAPVEAGNLETVAANLGTPPAGLPDIVSVIGIQNGHDVVQLPTNIAATPPPTPKATVFAPTATYRLTAVAQTSTGGDGPQSIILRHSPTPTLSAGTWLVPATGVTATRTSASFQPVSGVKAHSVQWIDSTGTIILEITLFDPTKTTATVPDLVALPSTGTLTAKVQGIGADFEVTDFSLDTDKDKLSGISAQPVNVP